MSAPRAWLLLLASGPWVAVVAAEQPIAPPMVSDTCGTPIGGVLGGKVPSLAGSGGTESVSGTITFPRATGKIAPMYPESARLARVGGKVILNIVVCRDGSVEGIQVLKTPSKELADAAAEAVRQWTYRPATRDGETVAVYLTVAVDFNLTP